MLNNQLTRKQKEVFDFLLENYQHFDTAPTLDELCAAMHLKSRGSLHKHIQGLVDAGLVEAQNGKQRGVRLTAEALLNCAQHAADMAVLPFAGVIAAGVPIEAIEDIRYMSVPEQLKTEKPCFILQTKGDSMVDAGIFDGDWIIVEKRDYASNGEIVVALIDQIEATLKFIDQMPEETVLIPANATMQPMHYKPNQVAIQGVLVGQMRSYTMN